MLARWKTVDVFELIAIQAVTDWSFGVSRQASLPFVRPRYLRMWPEVVHNFSPISGSRELLP